MKALRKKSALLYMNHGNMELFGFSVPRVLRSIPGYVFDSSSRFQDGQKRI